MPKGQPNIKIPHWDFLYQVIIGWINLTIKTEHQREGGWREKEVKNDSVTGEKSQLSSTLDLHTHSSPIRRKFVLFILSIIFLVPWQIPDMNKFMSLHVEWLTFLKPLFGKRNFISMPQNLLMFHGTYLVGILAWWSLLWIWLSSNNVNVC